MLITIAFFACAVACAAMFRRTDELSDKLGIVIHWLVTFSCVASLALGIVSVVGSHRVAAGQASLVAFASVLSLAASVFNGWRVKPSYESRPVFWFKIMALAVATFAIYVAAAQ